MEIISSSTSPSNRAGAKMSAKSKLNVLVIYETVLSCLIAKQLCDHITEYTDRNIDTSWYSFNLLRGKDRYQFLPQKARSSDLILVAKSEKNDLPEHVVSLVDACKCQNTKDRKSILGVFALEEEETLEELAIFRDLRTRSSQNGLNFLALPFTLSPMGRTESVYDFVTKSPASEFVDFLRTHYASNSPHDSTDKAVAG